MIPTRLAALLALLFAFLPARAAAPFSHAGLTAVLARYVDATGHVDYRGLAADRAGLDAYLATVAATSPATSPASFPTADDQLAYWLNVYNALALRGVIDRPGLRSVRDVDASFFRDTTYVVGGRPLSLDAIENQIVRPQFRDPRVHFALNCQSEGCPRLPREAFDPARLQAQLDAAAREFCMDPQNISVDAAGVVRVSQIFEWFAADFSASGGVAAFIAAHGGPTGAKLAYLPYDWALSAQPGRGP